MESDLDFKLCSLEIKNGFNDFIVIAKMKIALFLDYL